ncbi:MAG: hypothetical protein WHT46_10030 [Candidatus Geothermincolales bacterium]
MKGKRPSSPDGFVDGELDRVGEVDPGENPSDGEPERVRRFVVTISGSRKDSGKSTLAVSLVKGLVPCAAAKVAVHGEEPPGERFLEEREPVQVPSTDTARLLEAGARPVYLLKTTEDLLARDLEDLMERLGPGTVVLEGNRILRHLEPDYAVFVMDSPLEEFKPSAREALARAHSVVLERGALAPGTGGAGLLALERRIKELNPKAKLLVVEELGFEGCVGILLSRILGKIGGDRVTKEVDEKVLQAVREKAQEGRLPCADALRLAEELGVPPLEVGKAANLLGVKIVRCSLGCF